MKESIFVKLAGIFVAVAIVSSCAGIVSADENDKCPVDSSDTQAEADEEEFTEVFSEEEIYIPEIDYDNDELAEQYILQNMSASPEICYSRFDYTSLLSEYDQIAYNYILPVIGDIADGRETDTVISIPDDVLSFKFTAEDLELSDLESASALDVSSAVSKHLPVSSRRVMDVLLYSCPFDLYWFDKTTGCRMTYSYSRSSSVVRIYNFAFKFSVASEYQDGGQYKMNTLFGESVRTAAENAGSIIDDYSALSDYDKLLAYNNRICLLTDYNYAAANGGANYGNPWQLVWVFDGDDSTKVVCEGYSKAFKYLCDNSVFRSSSIYVLLASGKLDGGNHMWNVVHMDDGKNYMVDVTNSDPGGEDEAGQSLFMVGFTSGSAESGYVIRNKNSYKYDSRMFEYFDSEDLSIAPQNYDPSSVLPVYVLVLNDYENGTVSLDKYEAHEGDEITVTCVPQAGYELDAIKINGTAITGNVFSMPDEDVTVSVTFKQKEYEISVTWTTGGSASVSKAIAHYGDEITVSSIPDKGFELHSVEVDGVLINGNKFTVSGDVSVLVSFVKKDYTVSVNPVGGNATVSKTVANYGDEISITCIPFTGYELDSIKINGTPLTGNKFSMPDKDVTVSVAFKKINYTVSIADLENGSATVSKTVAYYGDEITITVSPDEGYELESVIVNGETISGLRFTMPAGNVEISITLKEKDISKNGWVLEGSDYYYFNKGDMVTGWVKSGYWYYMDPETGKMVTGWNKVGNAWFYFASSGAMATGWQRVGNIWYYFETSGAMVTGWKRVGNIWYYFASSGAMVTGWQHINDIWYYFETSGAMVTGWKKVGSVWYYFASSGAMSTGWLKIDSDWYYLEPSGVMVTGWKKIGNDWYYFYSNGVMAYNTEIDGYILSSSGAMI